MDDNQFRLLIDRFGYSWEGYRRVRKGVKKRLSRHMQTIRCRNVKDYINLIERISAERSNFEHLMTVSISRFFRDKELWTTIKEQILLELFRNKSRTIRVWFAGCASGEEVYTFKILWEALRFADTQLPDIHIIATDMNPEYLNRAKQAVYTLSSMRNVGDAIRSTYFIKQSQGRFAVRAEIKTGIIWQIHQLLSDPPEDTFDLIFIRNNLLTYYADRVKIPAFKRVANQLATGGFLVIGRNEDLPDDLGELTPWQNSRTIFRN